ncbi:MAG: DUF2971 domain-containing protein [Gemmatimonadetes bacterium]|nr:DUF2971 domain-containing protein [Gemmatimonadota bacterium]
MPTLYKYATAETAAKVLATRSLRWSSPILFNDPFDVRREFELPFTNAEYAKAVVTRAAQYARGEAEPKTLTLRALSLVLRGALSRGIPEAVVLEDLRSSLAMTIIPVELTRQELRRVWSERVPNMRIICFSSDAESPSMWAHYAADLTGVVLGFESSDERDSPWLRRSR